MNFNKLFQKIEAGYPFGISIMLLGIAFATDLPNFGNDRKDIVSGTLSFGAIILGFLATSKTILIGFKDNSSYAKLKETGYAAILGCYLATAIYSSLALCVLLLLMYFCTSYIFDRFYVFLVSMTLLSFVRVLRAQIAILKI